MTNTRVRLVNQYLLLIKKNGSFGLHNFELSFLINFFFHFGMCRHLQLGLPKYWTRKTVGIQLKKKQSYGYQEMEFLGI